MADDILIRLRAEADTTAMKEAVAGLQRIADMQRRNGASEKEAQSYSIAQWAKIEAAARKAGVSVQQYFANVEAKQRAATENTKRNTAVIEQQTAAFSRQSNVTGKLTRELGAMAAGYLTISAVTRTVSESFTQFAKLDTQLRRMQNQAGVTREEIDSLRPMFDRLSKASGRSVTDLVAGFDEIRENANLSIPETRKVFAAIVQGADAAGVSVKDMSNSFATTMLNMSVKGTDVAKVMDQMAMASADLRLDFGQMVGQMPKLTEAFGSIGFKGEQGNAAMLAWVSTLRKVTSGSGEAGQAAARMAEQVAGPSMAKALGLPQQELERIVEQAKDEGKDVMSVVTGILLRRSQLTGKSIESLLRDMSVRERRYWRAAVEGRDQALEATQRLQRASEGASRKMSDNIRKGPEKAIADLTNAWSKFKDSLGETVDSIGVTSALKGVSDFLDNIIRLMAVVRGERSWADYQKEEAERDAAKLEESEADKWNRLKPTEGIGTRRTGSRGAGQPPTTGIVPMPRRRPADAEDETIPEGATPIGPGAPRAAEPLPNWMQRQLTPGGGPGGTGGFGYRFADGNFGGGGSIAGRNWKHDLLEGSPASTNVEDRRTEEHQTDALQANTAAIQHLTDLLDDVDGVGGDLADQLGGGSIGGGGGGGRGRGGRGGGVAQRFSGGGGGGMEGGGGRAGTGAGGSGGGGMGGGGGGGNASGSGGGPSTGGGGGGGTGNSQGSGPAAPGDAMAPAGTSTRAAGETVEVTTNGGKKVRVAKEFAENFRGFLNDYEAAGGKISQGSTGGLNTRPGNASYHPLGRAIDVNQHSRDVISSGLPGGTKQEEELAKKWGLRAGSQFRNPDRGHYEVHKRADAKQALIDQGIIKPDGTPTSPGDRTGTGTPGVTPSTGGKAGTIDRSSLAPQLDDTNVRLMAGLTKAETGSVAGTGSKQFLAGHMNRTLIEKNATLKNRVYNGYYPGTTLRKLNNVSDAEVEQFKKKTLNPVMEGEGGDSTHNASLGLANRQERKYGGTRDANNELFYNKTGEKEKLNRFRRKTEPPDKQDAEAQQRNAFSERARIDRRKQILSGPSEQGREGSGYAEDDTRGRKYQDLKQLEKSMEGHRDPEMRESLPSDKPKQLEVKHNHKMDLSSRTQFARRDREYDKGAQSALNRASENSHADIGVA